MGKTGVRQIAKLANVSIGTVDRALNNRPDINPATRKRVLWVAKQLGYRPNPAAQALSVAKSGKLIGVCIPREVHFFYDQLRSGIFAEAKRFAHTGIDIVYRSMGRNYSDSTRTIRDLLNKKIHALILTPGNPESLISLVDEAEKNNIRVICVASDAPVTRRSSAVCVDSEMSGKLASELMGKGWIAGARVAVVTGILQMEDHRKKVESFTTHFPSFCSRGEVVSVIEGHGEEAETFQKCLKLLSKPDAVDGIYVSTANCLPVCRALDSSGLAGKVKLITTDLFKEMVPYFEKETIFASLYQRPYLQGELAVRLVVDHFLKGQPLPPLQLLSPIVVMRSNLAIFREILQRSSHARRGVGNGRLRSSFQLGES